jgi:hypothetical protein
VANIKINNTRRLDFKIRKDEYWDLMLSKDEVYGTDFDFDDSACLAAFVSAEEEECIRYFDKGKVFSSVSWADAVNSGDDEQSGVTLYNIGFTGVDNGLVFYDKNLIDNTQFFNYYTGSFYSTCGDTRLSLSVSKCNTGEHIYPIKVAQDESNKYFECKGGFLQGFYKTYGYDYQTLPDVIQEEWNMSFVIRPRNEYPVLEGTLNYEHPNNKGIFFYLGTRAENKFWDVDATDEEKSGFTAARYNIDGGYETVDNPNPDFTDKCSEEFQFIEETSVHQDECPIPVNWADEKYISEGYEPEEGTVLPGCPTAEESMDKNYINFDPCEEGENDPWVQAGYTVKEIDLSEIGDITTSNGHSIHENTDSYYEITSNNKYLLFNNTCTGYTVEKWIREDGENKTFVFTGKKYKKIPNYYLLFNQTCTGYTVNTIEEYLKSIQDPYDVYGDYDRNIFALKYNEDGSITYRYAVKDLGSGCPEYDYSTFDGEEMGGGVRAIEETTLPGLVKDGEWTNVHLRFIITNGGPWYKCKTVGNRKMKIQIYVNGFLKFISRPLPEFKFRALQEVYDKQESVPFNISLGGGTQGLADTVGLNFMEHTIYELPIEKHFGGSFLGDIRLFKFWACSMNFTNINALKKQLLA